MGDMADYAEDIYHGKVRKAIEQQHEQRRNIMAKYETFKFKRPGEVEAKILYISDGKPSQYGTYTYAIEVMGKPYYFYARDFDYEKLKYANKGDMVTFVGVQNKNDTSKTWTNVKSLHQSEPAQRTYEPIDQKKEETQKKQHPDTTRDIRWGMAFNKAVDACLDNLGQVDTTARMFFDILSKPPWEMNAVENEPPPHTEEHEPNHLPPEDDLPF